MRETLEIQYDGSSLSFRENECYESRGKCTIKLVQSAFDQLSTNVKHGFARFLYFSTWETRIFIHSLLAHLPKTKEQFRVGCLIVGRSVESKTMNLSATN